MSDGKKKFDPFDSIPDADAFEQIPDQDEWDAAVRAEADKLAQEDAQLPQVGVTPEGLDAEAAAKKTMDEAVKRAEPIRSPKRSVLGDLGQTAADGLRGLNAGLYLNGSDEAAAGLNTAAGGDFRATLDAERARNAEAQQRSPVAFNAMRTLGYVPGLVVGPATALGRVGMAGIQGLIGGALGSDSNDALQTVKDANKGGAIAATTSAGLQGLGNLSKFVGNRAANGPAPAAPPPPPAQQPLFPPPQAAPKVEPGFTSAAGLRSMADSVRQDPKAAQELMKTVGQVAGPVGGFIGMKTGHDPVTSMATGMLSSALAGPAAKATAKVAPPLLNGAADVVSGLGKLTAGAGNLMSGAGQVAAPLTSDANSLDVPEAALNALQNNRAILGSYAGQFAQAAGSPEPAAVGSLITRLTMTDPRFRTEVLPRLQEAAR